MVSTFVANNEVVLRLIKNNSIEVLVEFNKGQEYK